ncbi:Leucyl aminopeptidase yscIV [Microbotryomycetes sp. JL221]|nr:Leucyl aminopeptidase yscIV [Microbotryomycetes sp. JL221]
MAATQKPVPPSNDPSTQSNYHDIKTTHIHLDWTVDWKHQVIAGSVKHTLLVIKDTDKLVLDSSYIDIKQVELGSSGRKLEHELAPRHKVMGSALTVQLDRMYKAQEIVDVVVYCTTTKDCTALDWLRSEQTDSKKFPFMYSQCQAIHARSLLPCQDTPAVKLTYSAEVKSPLPILMSAIGSSPSREDISNMVTSGSIDPKNIITYKYEQKVAIPSYLIAVAGGELVFAPLGPRTGVWAEPGVIKDAQWEFARDTEHFVSLAEDMTTPYVWGRFDSLVLPSTFPYGGMENSNMTFLTPALVVGDRSEVDVIAHELAHSWTGNSVGCANWASFWLNESFTTYLERALIEKLHGPAERGFSFLVGKIALDQALKKQAACPKYQRLHIDYLRGEDPDDGYSTVQYDKGGNLLLHIESIVGGLDEFLKYVKAYIVRFTGLAITTDDWLAHFWEYWNQYPDKAKAIKEQVDFDAWLYGEGLNLPVEMKYNTTLADNAYALAQRWDDARAQQQWSSFTSTDVKEFSSNQVGMFLDTLTTQDTFPKEAVEQIENAYGVNTTKNPEIRFRWYLFALKSGQFAQDASFWVRTAGRMKYCRPVYSAINKVDHELAVKTFNQHGRSFLHPIARQMVEKDLGLA